jgi:hypothetical protein
MVMLPCSRHGSTDPDGRPVVEVPIDHVFVVPLVDCFSGIETDRVRAVCAVAEPHMIRWDAVKRWQLDALLDAGARRGVVADVRALVAELRDAYRAGVRAGCPRAPRQWSGPDAAIDAEIVEAFVRELDDVDDDSIADRALARIQEAGEVAALRLSAGIAYAEVIGESLQDADAVARLTAARDAFMERTLGGAS